MIKFKRSAFIAVMVIATLLALGNLATPAQANIIDITTPTSTGTPRVGPENQGELASPEQQEELKAVIQSYFETSYQALSISQPDGLQMNDLGDSVSEELDAKDFRDVEAAKRKVEKKHAELNHLKYVDYKYFLDFRSITVDPNTQTATVSVSEDNEVIYEISVEINPQEPIVSKRFNIEHTIMLKLKNGQWKIVSDDYNDYLWMILRKKEKSTDEIIHATNEMLNTMKAALGPAVPSNGAETMSVLSLPEDSSTHAYDRDAAVAYATRYTDSDEFKDEWNPNYPAYDKDCQNFVSQALYEGGNISMEIPPILPPPSVQGQSGWYSFGNLLQHATDWNDVQGFYNFVNDRSETITEGPEGYELPIIGNTVPFALMKGDVIQYQWDDGDDDWDHSVIVDIISGGMPYIDSHTEDHLRVPFSALSHKAVRFIHIERSDGYPPVKSQITTIYDDASGNPGGSCPLTNGDPGNNYLGGCFNGSVDGVTSGFLFKNVQIPRGVHIKYAYITFSTDGTYVPVEGMPGVFAPIRLDIYGENSALPLSFATANPPPAARALIPSTPVPWHIDGTISPEYDTWNWKDKRASPDIAPVIQALIDRPDWVSGHPLSIILKNGLAGDTHARRVMAYEALLQDPNGLTPARLIVAYDNAPVISQTIPSSGAQDGWVLESKASSNVGGSNNATNPTFFVGDDRSDKDYRGILHFETGDLPDNAVITSAVLKIKQSSIVGTDPFTTHGDLIVNIKNPSFGTPSLAKTDYEAEPGAIWVASFDPIDPILSNNWYSAQIDSTGIPFINRTGTTQFRLQFLNGDNNDLGEDYIAFFSGNNATDKPQLIITYYLP